MVAMMGNKGLGNETKRYSIMVGNRGKNEGEHATRHASTSGKVGDPGVCFVTACKKSAVGSFGCRN